MKRYFSIYVAVLAVLALLLFLSPQIAKFISADQENQQILRSVNFKVPVDTSVWQSRLGNPNNIIETKDTKLIISNAVSKSNYSLLTQRISLKNNRIYRIEITYSREDTQKSGVASFGVLKQGHLANSALYLPLYISEEPAHVTKYFKNDNSYEDPYFYILLSGSGSLEIESLKLEEISTLPENSKLEKQSNKTISL